MHRHEDQRRVSVRDHGSPVLVVLRVNECLYPEAMNPRLVARSSAPVILLVAAFSACTGGDESGQGTPQASVTAAASSGTVQPSLSPTPVGTCSMTQVDVDDAWARAAVNRSDWPGPPGSYGRVVESTRFGGPCRFDIDPVDVGCPTENGWPSDVSRATSTQFLGALGVQGLQSSRVEAGAVGNERTWMSQTRYMGGDVESIRTWLDACANDGVLEMLRVDDRGRIVNYFQFSGPTWTDATASTVVNTVLRRG